MKECIYYDLDEVHREDCLRARALAGDNALEIVPEGVTWPEDAPGRDPERIFSRRNLDYLEGITAWIERLREGLEAFSPGGATWQRHGISILEVARYCLMLNLAVWEHRWWAVNEVQRRWSPARVYWVARPRRQTEVRDLQILFTCASEDDMQVHYAGLTPALARMRDLRHKLWEIRHTLTERVTQTGRALLGPKKWPVSNGKYRVVFTEYYPNSARASLPVAKQLEGRPEIDVVWLAGRVPVQETLNKLGVSSHLLQDMVSSQAILRGHLSVRERRTLHQAVQALPERCFSGTTEGLSGRRYLSRVMRRELIACASQAAYWIEVYHDVLGHLRPDVVVSTTYNSIPGRAAALTARAHGAKSAYIQHGILVSSYFNTYFCNDLIFVWGRYEQRNLLCFGHEASAVHVMGSSLYDDFIRRIQHQRTRPFPKPGEPLRIAFMASRTGGAVSSIVVSRATIQAVAEAARSTPGAHLSVKVHPGDSTTLPEEVMRNYPEFRLVRSGNSQDVIMESDLVIVVSSTTGYEACLADRPLIVLDLTGMRDHLGRIEYEKYGAAIVLTRAEDLRPTIQRLQTDETSQSELANGRRKLIDDMLNGGSGNAAELAAGVIRRCLEELQ